MIVRGAPDRSVETPLFRRALALVVRRHGLSFRSAADVARGAGALRLPFPVDLVTAGFDAIDEVPTLAGLTRAFTHVAANLRPGGHFVFGAVTTCRPFGGARLVVRRRRMRSLSMMQGLRWDPLDKTLSSLVVRTRVDRARGIEVQHKRAFALRELDLALSAAGLVTRGVYDFATMRPAALCAPRLLVLAERPG